MQQIISAIRAPFFRNYYSAFGWNVFIELAASNTWVFQEWQFGIEHGIDSWGSKEVFIGPYHVIISPPKRA